MDDNLERQQDELEALRAMYPDEFTETSSGDYRVTISSNDLRDDSDGVVSLRFVLPVDYPSHTPPRVWLVCDDSSFDRQSQPLVTEKRLTKQTQRMWEEGGRGEVLFELIGWLTEQIQNRAETQVAQQQQRKQEEEQKGRVASADCTKSIIASLQEVGYETHGMCFIHEQEPRCEVELFELEATSEILVTVTAAGLGEEELANFVAMELAADRPDEFGAQLLEGVRNMLYLSGVEADADVDHGSGGGTTTTTRNNADDFLARAIEKLPSVEEIRSHPRWLDHQLHINRNRQLHIYTWGDALMKKTALKTRNSQFDINAKPLNGRGGGADTKQNALQDQRIVLNVAASLADARGMQLLVHTLRKIEAEDLRTISVFCTKGRHRSVSMAVLLQQAFYPNAKVEHLTIR